MNQKHLKCTPTKRVSKRIPRKNASEYFMGDIQEMGLQRHNGSRRTPVGEVVVATFIAPAEMIWNPKIPGIWRDSGQV